MPSFDNAMMLAGLGGAMIPLVLHLLARSRHRTVDWGAMIFLEGIEANVSRAARLRQWVLLALRMLLVGTLATALARPVLHRSTSLGQAPVTAVIILDRSFSLGYEEAGRTRFDRAREAAMQIIAALRKGDQAMVILAGDDIERLTAEPTTNLQSLARQLADVQLGTGGADLPQALVEARRVLEHADGSDRELYLVTDRQAHNWRDLSLPPGFTHFLRGRPPTRFVVLPVGGEEADNVALEGIELDDPVPVRYQPTWVQVRLRNHGATPRAGMDVTLSMVGPGDGQRRLEEGGARLATASVTVPARSSATVRLGPITFSNSGSHALMAQVKSAGLGVDNRIALACDVIDPIDTLIISGDERSEDLRRESFFLKLALAPMQGSGRRGDPAVATVRPLEDISWPALNLNRYPVIVLANVPQLPPEAARALEQRVYEGAGLIVAPGSLCQVDNYNAVLYRDGLGLLPAKLSGPTPGDGTAATSLLGMDLSHPVFRFRRSGEVLPTAVIGRHFRAQPRPADSKVLAELASGDPFLIEGPRGRGKVLLLTTPLDADWSTLPLHSFYLPFVQSMVRHAAASPNASKNLAPGERLSASFEEPADEVLVDDIPAREGLFASGTQFRHEFRLRPGVHRLSSRMRGGQWRVAYCAVRSPGGESDLTPMSAQAWRDREKAIGFERIEAPSQGLSRTLAAQRGGRELWAYLLAAALGIALLEMGLSRRWTEGAP